MRWRRFEKDPEFRVVIVTAQSESTSAGGPDLRRFPRSAPASKRPRERQGGGDFVSPLRICAARWKSRSCRLSLRSWLAGDGGGCENRAGVRQKIRVIADQKPLRSSFPKFASARCPWRGDAASSAPGRPGLAKEMIFSGLPYTTALDALRIGLVNKGFPAADLSPNVKRSPPSRSSALVCAQYAQGLSSIHGVRLPVL